MALQNIRALRILAEDLSFGAGNSKDVTMAQTVAAAARPIMQTVGFAGSTSASFIGTGTPSLSGTIRALTSRSPNYFMTLTATLNGTAVTIPIPPLATVFLPLGLSGSSGTLAANYTGAPAGVPIASATTRLTVDCAIEQ